MPVLNTIQSPPVFSRVVAAQLGVAGLGAAGVLAVAGPGPAGAALLGGGISAAANGYFAYRAFRYRGARQARRVVRGFMGGVMGKLAITAGMFGLCFSLIDGLHAPALLGGFAAATVTGILTAARI